ncbi:MAG: hypothetical protein HRU26_17520 [Psychroserpens sp.]|nr:hypothetical protein [Psychroserpens sp.]
MKESKEIETAKAKKFIDNYIKLFEGLEQYDDEHGKPFDLEFTCAIMEAFNDQETKKLREENANYKAMNKTLRDQVKQWEKVPNLKELREENERLKEENDKLKSADYYGSLEITEKAERIQELEEGIRHLIGPNPVDEPYMKYESSDYNAKYLTNLITKDTKKEAVIELMKENERLSGMTSQEREMARNVDRTFLKQTKDLEEGLKSLLTKDTKNK